MLEPDFWGRFDEGPFLAGFGGRNVELLGCLTSGVVVGVDGLVDVCDAPWVFPERKRFGTMRHMVRLTTYKKIPKERTDATLQG